MRLNSIFSVLLFLICRGSSGRERGAGRTGRPTPHYCESPPMRIIPETDIGKPVLGWFSNYFLASLLTFSPAGADIPHNSFSRSVIACVAARSRSWLTIAYLIVMSDSV